MKLKPVENNVLLLCLKDPEKSEGGLFIPDVAKGKERPRRGRIVAVGAGPKRGKNLVRTPMELWGASGESVIYDELSVVSSCEDLRIDDCKHVLVNEDGILGLLLHVGENDFLAPIHDRVVVQPAKAEAKTPGGLFVPDVAKRPTARGAVVAAGMGKANDDGVIVPLDVRAGDDVIFYEDIATEVTVGGVRLLVLREEEIHAVVEPEA